jgi:hypothetical protein
MAKRINPKSEILTTKQIPNSKSKIWKIGVLELKYCFGFCA